MTFQEMADKITLAEIFNGTAVPAELQATVLDWYFDRKVCDNDKFLRYFRRQVNLIYPEYERLISVESIQVNPLYTELLTRVKRNHGELTETGEQSGNNLTYDSDEHKVSGESKNVVSNTNTGTATTETEGTDSRTKNTTVTDNGSSSNSHTLSDTTKNQGLTSALPDTTTYTAFPEAMAWNSANGQTETKSNTERIETDTGTTNDTQTTADTESGSSTGKNTSTHNDQINTTQDNTATQTDTISRERSVEATSSNSLDRCESYFEDETVQGYKGFTAKNLSDFWNWIKQSHSIKWFLDNLDICFMGVFY